MKFRSTLYILTLLMAFSAFAQEEINNYKYILVPNNFDFLKEKDQYKVNSLTKFLFDKYGYNAFMEDADLPADLQADPCLALKADVAKVSGGFLVTKLQIDLKDCRNNLVVSSKVGKSKVKDFQGSYHEALREAFQTFQYFQYAYNPSSQTVPAENKAPTITVEEMSQSENSKAKNAEIERLKREVEALQVKKQEEKTKPVESVESAVVEVIESSNAEIKLETVITEDLKNELLYAQPIANGFQIVDTEPKKVMILLKTGKADIFIVKGQDAIVYKEGNDWVFVSADTHGHKMKKLQLKF